MIKDKLYERVKRFMDEEGVSCVDAIYQRDSVIEAAYGFIEDLYEIIEDDLPKEDD